MSEGNAFQRQLNIYLHPRKIYFKWSQYVANILHNKKKYSDKILKKKLKLYLLVRVGESSREILSSSICSFPELRQYSNILRGKPETIH